MTIVRGVSLYSYQQAQFFKELDLEAQLREVGENLDGADGVEILDEMSLPYPAPPPDFLRRWDEWFERYQLTPVTMDVFWDVLQFRDHVMTHHEGAARLVHDLGLASRLGFTNGRVLATHPIEVMTEALPVAEELGIRIVKEIHQPMGLTGQHVQEIADVVDRTGTRHLGILIDCGIFQFRPSEPLLGWYRRRGAKKESCELVVELSLAAHHGDESPFLHIDTSAHTAGNIRAEFLRFLNGGTVANDLEPAFRAIKSLVAEHVPDPSDLDHTVIAEGLNFSHATAAEISEVAPLLYGVRGKFYEMTEVAGRPGMYEDASIDYPAAIEALRDVGYSGYVNSEYEGQRFFQDRGRDELADEIDQVRRHQEMLGRLITA